MHATRTRHLSVRLAGAFCLLVAGGFAVWSLLVASAGLQLWIAAGLLMACAAAGYSLALLEGARAEQPVPAPRASGRIEAVPQTDDDPPATDFLAQVSRELRSPMQDILGISDQLRESDLDGQQSGQVAGIHRSATALVDVIDRIVDYSRLEADAIQLNREPFAPRQLVEDALELVSPNAHRKGLILSGCVDPGVPLGIVGDEMRLQQVLVNLLANAVKFTDSGEITVTARLAASPDGAAMLEFEVVDTGIGIAASQQAAVFSNDGGSALGASGMGLAIAQRLVQMHDGQIGLDSDRGEGSRFWFRIPVQEAQLEQAWTVDSSLLGCRMLVCSEHRPSRGVLSQHLGSFAVVNSVASSAAGIIEGLRTAHASGDPFAVTILDADCLDQPVEEILDRMARDPQLATSRVLIVHGVEKDAGKGDHGCVRMPNPVRRKLLHDRLLEALRQNPRPRVPQRRSSGTVEPATRDSGRTSASAHTAPHPAPSSSASRPVAADSGNRPIADKARHGHVLLVDDNIVNRRVADLMLSKAGYEVTTAIDGENAITILQAGEFDLILMDVHMPRLDGLAATGRIREIDGERSQIPIIAMTASAMYGDAERCIQAGMDYYVAKPVKAQVLIAAVEKWIGRKHGDISESQMVPIYRAPNAGESLDEKILDELRSYAGDEPGLLAELGQAFIEGAARRIGDLYRGQREGNVDLMLEAAHTLKGSAGTLGATQLQEMSRELEDMVREHGTGHGTADLDRIAAELDRVHAALDRALGARL